MIVVVDYGVNNLRSVVRGLVAAGFEAVLTTDPRTVGKADRVVVPGVGHFAAGIRSLTRSGLADAVRSVAQAGRPVFGICLGMQLLFGQSEEEPTLTGLGLLPGRIIRFRTDLRVPHVGWAEVTMTAVGRRHPVIARAGRGDPVYYYHVHSYHPVEVPDESVLGTADYGATFPTLVAKDNVLGAQFHPEKSQEAGIALLGAFAAWKP